MGPVCASAVRRRTAGDATVTAPARPALSIALLDGRKCPDMCLPLPWRCGLPLASCSFHPLNPDEPTGGAARPAPTRSQTLLRGLGMRRRRLDDPGLEV